VVGDGKHVTGKNSVGSGIGQQRDGPGDLIGAASVT
jgi:hypothetical protein